METKKPLDVAPASRARLAPGGRRGRQKNQRVPNGDYNSENSDRSGGFTLIEILIYIAIMGVIVTGFITFSISISNTRNKTFVVQEVHSNSRTALNLISQRIRSSTGINSASSTFGADPGVLSLSMAASFRDPTVIDLDQNDGVLRIGEATSSPVAITTDKVKITNLVFTNLTPSGERESIRVEITVEYKDSSGDIIFTYSQNSQTTVSVRQ